jgi:peptidyl-prolyl cis-trans isomerase C
MVPQSAPHSVESEPHGSQIGTKLSPLARRWLREPLLHFLLAGAIVFATYELVNPAANRTDQINQIVLTKDDLRQLAVVWLAQGRRPPTADEMRALVEERVRQEILFREARALGLDKDDEIVKRRMVQKMDFLAADVAALQDPSDAELEAWFAQNSDRFALPPRVSFRHLYFSSGRPGAQDRAAAILDKISGKPAQAPEVATGADPFMFQDYYAERTPDQIAKEFGPPFAKALFQLRPDAWQGAIESGYGWHLVFVENLEPRRVPAFTEVESDVKSALLDQKQREIKRTAFEAMRAHYTIVVPPIESVDWGSLQRSGTRRFD